MNGEIFNIMADIIPGLLIGIITASFGYFLGKRKARHDTIKNIYSPIYEEIGRIINRIEQCEEAHYTQIGVQKKEVSDFLPWKSWSWWIIRETYLNVFVPKEIKNTLNNFYDNEIEQYSKKLTEAIKATADFVEKKFNEVGIKRVGQGEPITEETIDHIFGVGLIIALLKKDVSYYNSLIMNGKTLKGAFEKFGKHFPEFENYEKFFNYFSSEVEGLKEVTEFRKKQTEILEKTEKIRKMLKRRIKIIW